MNQQTKTGRGGARPNSGAKPKGIKTKVVRIDAMLYPLVLTLQCELRDGNLSRDDIRELMSRAEKRFIDDSEELLAQIAQLEFENQALKAQNKANSGDINDKLRKRLIQFCHPDKHHEERTKKIASELTSELNLLSSANIPF